MAAVLPAEVEEEEEEEEEEPRERCRTGFSCRIGRRVMGPLRQALMPRHSMRRALMPRALMRPLSSRAQSAQATSIRRSSIRMRPRMRPRSHTRSDNKLRLRGDKKSKQKMPLPALCSTLVLR